MIDYLISDLKKIGLIWSYILKFIKFIIFKDFFGIFLNFSDFILDLFGFLKIKKSRFYRALTWQLKRWRSDMSPRGDRSTGHVAHMCVRVCARAHAKCNQCDKHPLRIFANPLYVLYLYTHQIVFIFVMWDYLSFYIFAGDVARQESFDSGT